MPLENTFSLKSYDQIVKSTYLSIWQLSIFLNSKKLNFDYYIERMLFFFYLLSIPIRRNILKKLVHIFFYRKLTIFSGQVKPT